MCVGLLVFLGRGVCILTLKLGHVITQHTYLAQGILQLSGGSPIVRPFHCTLVGLTNAIAPNVGDSGAQILLVGDCVRAIPSFRGNLVKY